MFSSTLISCQYRMVCFSTYFSPVVEVRCIVSAFSLTYPFRNSHEMSLKSSLPSLLPLSQNSHYLIFYRALQVSQISWFLFKSSAMLHQFFSEIIYIKHSNSWVFYPVPDRKHSIKSFIFFSKAIHRASFGSNRFLPHSYLPSYTLFYLHNDLLTFSSNMPYPSQILWAFENRNPPLEGPLSPSLSRKYLLIFQHSSNVTTSAQFSQT